MKYTYLGKSGLAVSSLCLGTMTFGGTTDEKDSKEMIHRFLDLGGNFVDTADVYTGGRSEEIVGKSIRDRRSEVILASKVRMSTAGHVNGQGSSRKHIMDGIDGLEQITSICIRFTYGINLPLWRRRFVRLMIWSLQGKSAILAARIIYLGS
ncbi:General stress protein 69 [compost metagenome]